MATKKLTKTAVDDLGAADKAIIVFDTEVKGFGVRVALSGTKTWVLEYRPYPGGRGVSKRRLVIGTTQSHTAEEARKKARQVLAEVAQGADPAKDKSDKRKEMRVSGLVDLYEHEGCYILRGTRQGTPMKPTTKAYTIARLRHHAVPTIGNLRVSEVTPSDIERMVRAIRDGKTARDEKVNGKRVIVRGGEGASRKVARDVSAMFTFAIGEKLAAKNPCENAKVNKIDNKRKRYLNLDEVRRLGKALDDLEAAGVNPKALNIARLWALTGCRRDEIAALKWAEVDFERECLVLEDSKTGASERPLASAAFALLSSIPKEDKSPFVFPAMSSRKTGAEGKLTPSHFQGTKRIWPKAIAKAQLPGVTPHTLRHTLGSTAVSTGESLAMTGAILGHANPRSTAIYAHVQNDPAKRAATRAVGPIAAALAGDIGARIIPLRGRR